MSEAFIPRHEQESQPENRSEEQESAHNEQLEKLRAEGEIAAEQQKESIEKLESAVEDTAKSAEEVKLEQVDTVPQGGLTVLGTQKELKNQSYERKLKQVRSHLSAPERSFSKVVHHSVVNAVSETSGKTVFRPSGMLVGALTALVGSVVLLYMSKHYGFRYNYLVFFMLFAVGFAVGIVLELVVRLVKRRTV